MVLHCYNNTLYPLLGEPFLVNTLFLSDKLWEGKGKTVAMKVKDKNPKGATFEFTWAAKLMGSGKASGVNVTLYFTADKNADFYGAGPTVGQGAFFTRQGQMVTVRSSGFGKPHAGHGRAIEIWCFSTEAEDLDWLNRTAAVVSIEGDDKWQEFNVTVNEWNPT